MVADVVGSLKKPCKAGRPDMAIGTNGESLKPGISKLILGFQDLSIKSLSDPLLDQINLTALIFESSLSSL
jgi:hypothetical protein